MSTVKCTQRVSGGRGDLSLMIPWPRAHHWGAAGPLLARAPPLKAMHSTLSCACYVLMHEICRAQGGKTRDREPRVESWELHSTRVGASACPSFVSHCSSSTPCRRRSC